MVVRYHQALAPSSACNLVSVLVILIMVDGQLAAMDPKMVVIIMLMGPTRQ